MENNQKYALITGATSGIGFEFAKLFAHHNYNLVIVARSQEALDNTAIELEQFGVDVIKIAKDLFKKEEAYSLCEEVKTAGIDIDVLINDAGQGLYGQFKDTDLERELDIIQLNIGATVILTKHFLKDMIARNEGRILNLGSIAGKLPGPWQSIYHGTKAFILSFTAAIREELKDTNVTVTALLPGVTDTDFFNKAEMNDSKMVQDKDSMSDPADVAKDGYDALMAGEGRVISGLKNKVQVNMNNLVPDSVVAKEMYAMQQPVENS
jgi:short-subunit dehydrogenase